MFVPGRPFHPRVLFASKAQAYPREGPLPQQKILDEHPSLLRTIVNYGRKKFQNMGTRKEVWRFADGTLVVDIFLQLRRRRRRRLAFD